MIGTCKRNIKIDNQKFDLNDTQLHKLLIYFIDENKLIKNKTNKHKIFKNLKLKLEIIYYVELNLGNDDPDNIYKACQVILMHSLCSRIDK